MSQGNPPGSLCDSDMIVNQPTNQQTNKLNPNKPTNNQMKTIAQQGERDYQAHAYNVNSAIEMLQDADDETMMEIIKGVGMEWKMLRQLMLSAPLEQVEYLMEEKKNLDINC